MIYQPYQARFKVERDEAELQLINAAGQVGWVVDMLRDRFSVRLDLTATFFRQKRCRTAFAFVLLIQLANFMRCELLRLRCCGADRPPCLCRMLTARRLRCFA